LDFLPLQSFGTLIFSGMALFSGLVYLFVWSHRRRRADMSFALCCLALAVFDLGCGMNYAMDSGWGVGFSLRLEYAALALAFFFFFDFCHDYLSLPASPARPWLAALLMMMAMGQALNPLNLAWQESAPSLRHFCFLGASCLSREMPMGALTMAELALGMGMALWLLRLSLWEWKRGARRGKGLALALLILILAGFSDLVVMLHPLPMIYLFDYSFAGVVALMAVAMARGLAETSEMKESLALAERRFRHIEEHSEEVFWEVNRFGFISYLSPRVAALTGFTPADLLGSTPWSSLPAAEAKAADKAWASLVAEGRELRAMEVPAQRRDGKPVTLEISGYPYHDPSGRLRGYRGLARDVTRRRQAEELNRKVRQRRSLQVMARSLGHDVGKLAAIILRNTEAAKDGMPEDSPSHLALERAEHAASRTAELAERMNHLFPEEK
jgi:PAS domain S-box-containing protein